MVAERVARPTVRRVGSQATGLVGAHPGWGQAFGLHEGKVENQVQLVMAVALVGDVIRLANEHGVGIGVHHHTELLHQLVQAGLIHLVAVHGFPLFVNLPPFRVRRSLRHQDE